MESPGREHQIVATKTARDPRTDRSQTQHERCYGKDRKRSAAKGCEEMTSHAETIVSTAPTWSSANGGCSAFRTALGCSAEVVAATAAEADADARRNRRSARFRIKGEPSPTPLPDCRERELKTCHRSGCSLENAGPGAKLSRVHHVDARGCSSVVERHVANVNVEGSTPFTRSFAPSLWTGFFCWCTWPLCPASTDATRGTEC